jgi:hypothetical protein
VAEAELEVTRIQQARIGIINRIVTQETTEIKRDGTDEASIASALTTTLPDLTRLIRYERRAISRLRKILRRFENS